MQTKRDFIHAIIFLFVSGFWVQAQALTREVEIASPLRVDWMAPDGSGGVYIRSNKEIYQIGPKGEMLPLRFPAASDSISPATMELFVSPDGCLWGLDLPQLFRMPKPGAWNEIRVAIPDDGKKPLCRIWGPDSTHLEILCDSPDSINARSAGYRANVDWPGISDWTPYSDSAEFTESYPRIGQHPTWTDINRQTRKEMQLVLEPNRPQDRRKSIWTFRSPDSGKGKDTIPFPTRWKGSRQGNGPSDVSTLVPLMVKSGSNIWIVLDQLIAVKSDSSWTLVYPSARVGADQASKSQASKRDSFRGPGGKTLGLLRTVPYLATAYLAYSAIESGPGWASEAGWAYGGTMLGMIGGVLGLGAVTAPCWNGSCPEAALPYLVSVLATLPLMGAAWAVQSHDTRTDRQWQRFGGAMLGAATGIGVCFVAPNERHSFLLGAASLGLGAVVGYRFAWY